MSQKHATAAALAAAALVGPLLVTGPAQAVTAPAPASAVGGGAGSIIVTWTPSAATYPLGYVAEAWTTGGALDDTCGAISTANTCTISGLTSGQLYNVLVTGRISDTQEVTVPAGQATPLGVPSAPTGLTGVAGNTQITYSWTAPVSNGGSAILSYTVSNATTGIAMCSVAAPATTCIATGLTNGTSYTAKVFATNAQGNSPLSTTSAAVTPVASTPGLPTSVAATPGDASATVTWTAPSPAPTGGYEIQSRLNLLGAEWLPATPLTSTTTSKLVTGLTNGLQYFFRVRATNGGALVGGWVETTTAITPGGAPAAPVSLTATPGNGQVAMSWSIMPGSTPTGYAVQYSTDNVNWLPNTATGQLTNSTAQSYTLTGLTNGTPYYLRVRALSGVLFSTWTQMAGTVTPVGPPAAPTNVTGLSGNGQVILNWTAPAVTAAAPVTGYRVQYSANGGVTWTAGPVVNTTATTATVTGLTNGLAYVFQVQASNGAGNSAWSATSAAVTPGAPAAPTSLTAVAGDSSAVMTWTILLGSAPTGYEVQYSTDNVNWQPTTPIPTGSIALTYTLTGLTNGVPYYLRVRAMNGPAGSAWTQMVGTVTPIVVKSIRIDNAERKRGVVIVTGSARGFTEVNVRIRVWKENKGKWDSWRSAGSADVVSGRYVFVIDKTQKIKVQVLKDGVKSQIVEVA